MPDDDAHRLWLVDCRWAMPAWRYRHLPYRKLSFSLSVLLKKRSLWFPSRISLSPNSVDLRRPIWRLMPDSIAKQFAEHDFGRALCLQPLYATGALHHFWLGKLPGSLPVSQITSRCRAANFFPGLVIG